MSPKQILTTVHKPQTTERSQFTVSLRPTDGGPCVCLALQLELYFPFLFQVDYSFFNRTYEIPSTPTCSAKELAEQKCSQSSSFCYENEVALQLGSPDSDPQNGLQTSITQRPFPSEHPHDN